MIETKCEMENVYKLVNHDQSSTPTQHNHKEKRCRHKPHPSLSSMLCNGNGIIDLVCTAVFSSLLESETRKEHLFSSLEFEKKERAF